MPSPAAARLAGLSLDMREMVLETLRGVLERDLPDARKLELDKNDEFPRDIIDKLLSPEVGLHLLFLPESVGGLDGGARDVCAVSETMAAADLGVATAFQVTCLGMDPIVVGGTDAQKARWLTRIAEEGLLVSYAVTEPEAGSNVASLSTTAEPLTDKDGKVTGYRLNGRKQFITNGSVADLYTVLARAPGGPCFFLAEKGTPGLSADKKEDKHGIRASDTTGLVLEDVEVPADYLVGSQEGQGLKQASAVFGYTRLMVGAFGLGGGQNALERAIAYARERVQFGSPLIEKQGYALKLLVPHWIDLAAGRAYVDETALRLDQGEKDLQVEGAIAKLWCSEAGNRAADASVQALGGYGYVREYMVEKIRRDVRITNIYEGTSEILQSIIALHRWRATVKSKGSLYGQAAAALAELEPAGVGAGLVAAALDELNATIEAAHRAKATRNQIVMFELADLVTRAEVAAALCRAAARRVEEGAADAATFAAMSRVSARQALESTRAGRQRCAWGLVDPGDRAAVEAVPETEPAPGNGYDAAAAAGLWRDMEIVAEALRNQS